MPTCKSCVVTQGCLGLCPSSLPFLTISDLRAAMRFQVDPVDGPAALSGRQVNPDVWDHI